MENILTTMEKPSGNCEINNKTKLKLSDSYTFEAIYNRKLEKDFGISSSHNSEKNIDKLKDKNPTLYKMYESNMSMMEGIGMSDMAIDKWSNTAANIPYEGLQKKFISLTNVILSDSNITDKSKASLINGMTDSVNTILKMDISDLEKIQKISALFQAIEKALDLRNIDDLFLKDENDEEASNQKESDKTKNVDTNIFLADNKKTNLQKPYSDCIKDYQKAT